RARIRTGRPECQQGRHGGRTARRSDRVGATRRRESASDRAGGTARDERWGPAHRRARTSHAESEPRGRARQAAGTGGTGTPPAKEENQNAADQGGEGTPPRVEEEASDGQGPPPASERRLGYCFSCARAPARMPLNPTLPSWQPTSYMPPSAR